MQDHEIINGICLSRQEANLVFDWIINRSNWFYIINNKLKGFGAKYEDAQDAFMEGLVDFELNITRGMFRSEGKLINYLLLICQRKYFARLNKPIPNDLYLDVDENHLEKIIIDAEELDLLKKTVIGVLENLGNNCKKVLELIMLNRSMVEISEEMNFTNIQSAKNAAFRCRKKFKEICKNDKKALSIIKKWI